MRTLSIIYVPFEFNQDLKRRKISRREPVLLTYAALNDCSEQWVVHALGHVHVGSDVDRAVSDYHRHMLQSLFHRYL